MTRRFLLLVVVTLSITAAHSQNGSRKLVYKPTGEEASVSGDLLFTGVVAPEKRVDVSADPVCEQVNPNLTWKPLAVTDGKLANALVYVSGGDALEKYSFESSDVPVTLEHTRCDYHPRVMGIQVDQPLAVVNSDRTQHNTHPRPTLNQEWNMSQGVGAGPIVKSFNRPELDIAIICNQHPWERAYLSVFAHPFFSVTDAGSFRIQGLPPGRYQLTIWHEKLKEKTVELTLTPGEAGYVAVSFNESDINDSSVNRRNN